MDVFLRFVYEAAQNLPLIAGCFTAIHMWRNGQTLQALLAMLVASAVAAAVIWVTEPLIFKGHREKGRQVIGNVIVFSLLMLVAALYWTARWSAWWTDLLAGLILAGALAAGQEFAAKERFGFIRMLWLALSCVGSLLMFRLLLTANLWVSITVVTLWFTVVMGLYKELRIRGFMGAPKPAAQTG